MADDFVCNVLLPRLETRIVALMDAIDALIANEGINEYWMDTGQTRTKVSRAELHKWQGVLDGYILDREIYRQRCGLASGTSTMRPGT